MKIGKILCILQKTLVKILIHLKVMGIQQYDHPHIFLRNNEDAVFEPANGE